MFLILALVMKLVFNEKKKSDIKMYGFFKKSFVVAMAVFDCKVLKVNLWKCVSMNNKECKIRPQIINFNSNEPSFYHCSVKISKCIGSCNNINDPYAKLGVPDAVKNINIKYLI